MLGLLEYFGTNLISLELQEVIMLSEVRVGEEGGGVMDDRDLLIDCDVGVRCSD